MTPADEAIQVLYTKMYPVPWAGKWALPSVLETRSPIQRPPVAKGFLDARFKGRRDDGPLPEMAGGGGAEGCACPEGHARQVKVGKSAKGETIP